MSIFRLVGQKGTQRQKVTWPEHMAGPQMALGPLVCCSLPFLVLSPRLSKMKINICLACYFPTPNNYTSIQAQRCHSHWSPLHALGPLSLVQVPLLLDNYNNSPAYLFCYLSTCMMTIKGGIPSPPPANSWSSFKHQIGYHFFCPSLNPPTTVPSLILF